MIDNLSIFLTCAGVILVAIRAIFLDAKLPWFRSSSDDTARPQDVRTTRQ